MYLFHFFCATQYCYCGVPNLPFEKAVGQNAEIAAFSSRVG